VTCHVLDTVSGVPAAGIQCTLSRFNEAIVQTIAAATTDPDGRIVQWNGSLDEVVKSGSIIPGTYKIRFNTGPYLKKTSGTGFFPFVDVVFEVADPADKHYHIPLLLSNYSYSTYRGS
jgi:5-hydroxyisourate hydrolase